MRVINLFIVLISVFDVCMGQNISISGTVLDNDGSAIAGATVRLQNADLETTTDNEGVFVFSQIADVFGQAGRQSSEAAFSLSGGRLKFNLPGAADVVVTVFDLKGTVIWRFQKNMVAGSHSLLLEGLGTGINFLKVKVGGLEKIFKSGVSGEMYFTSSTDSRKGTGALGKSAAYPREFEDVIRVTMDGYINSGAIVEHGDTSTMDVDTSDIEITMYPSEGDVTDIDGNVYQTVRIGNQVWMAQNLRVTRYNDGTPIQHAPENAEWDDLGQGDKRTPLYCFYANDSAANAEIYGAMYNWYAVGGGNLAPDGWRMPSGDDYWDLRGYLQNNGFNWDGTNGPNKVNKSMSANTDWGPSDIEGGPGHNPGANNLSGFSATPAGNRGHGGLFHSVGTLLSLWTSSGNMQQGGHTSYFQIHKHKEDLTFEQYGPNVFGHSVRLIKN